MTDACELTGCIRPTRDGAYFCEPCGDDFAKVLKSVVDRLDDDLEACIAGTKGISWQNGAPRGGGEVGIRVNWRAVDLYRSLHRALSEAVDHCIKARTRHSSPSNASPARTIPAMADWLRWRIDGLTLDPAGPKHVGGLSNLVERVGAVVDWEPPERRFLGACEICGEGHVYAEGDEIEAICNRCETAFAADLRGSEMLKKMDDMLFTAAKIAELSTYLGLRKDREKVRKQINGWSSRKVIEAKGRDKDGDPTFRLGDARHRLVLQDEAAKGSAS